MGTNLNMSPRLSADIDLLRAINAVQIANVRLPEYYTYQGVSVLSFFQGVLWSNIRRRSRVLSDQEVAQSGAPTGVLMGIFLVAESVTALLWGMIRRPDVILYSSDVVLGSQRGDSRISLVYDELQSRNVRYLEFVHAIPGRSTIKRWWTRRRPVVYLEALDVIYRLLSRVGLRRRHFPVADWKAISPEQLEPADRQFAFFMLKLVSRDAEEAVFRIDMLNPIIRLLHPKFLFTIDDPRHYHEILMAFRAAGIQSHSFQHGRFDQYFTGHIYYGIKPALCIIPDFFWVWNKYNRERLLQLSPIYGENRTRVRIGGRPFRKELPTEHSAIGMPVTILMLAEGYLPADELSAYLAGILALPDTYIIFSVRPDLPIDSQVKSLNLTGFAADGRLEVVLKLTESEFSRIHLVLGTTSTMLEEMIGAGYPVGVMATSATQAHDLVEDGLADWVTLDTLVRIHDIAHTDKTVLRSRSERLRTDIRINDTLNAILSSYDQKR